MVVLVFLLLACAGEGLDVPLPELVLSVEELTFTAAVGEYATAELAVSNAAEPSEEAEAYSPLLALGDGEADAGFSTTGASFCLHWATPECAEVVAAASGSANLCADGVAEAGDVLALPAGCSAPVTVVYAPEEAGEHLGAMRVASTFGPWSAVEEPGVWESSGDPTDPAKEVTLRGTATGAPLARLVLDPPLSAFPWHWPDGTVDETTFTLTNVGSATTRVGAPDFGCSGDWALVGAPTQGTELAAGASAQFTVSHTATEPDAEVCTLSFGASPGVESAGSVLRFASDTWSEPPSVTITSPTPGQLVASDERVMISFTLSDDQAPASGIYVTIWSAAKKATLASGVAPDDSGVVNFELAKGDLLAGGDTIRVSLLDWEGFTALDAVSFRVDTDSADDADGDSWGVTEGDCDDTNPAAFPGAVETVDGVDEDCDGTVDDGAYALDNDEDGLAETEGDCNDHDASVGPSAPELANNVDDDCDALVDEGTLRYDDDGDGYSELTDDCDDADPTVNPAATDLCGGLDRDCDGVLLDCPASLEGAFAQAVPDVCHPGGSITLTAVVPTAATRLAWTVDGGTVADPAAAVTTLTCPTEAGAVAVALQVNDAAGEQVFDSVKVQVVADEESLDQSVTFPANGCGGVLPLLGLGFGAGAFRRRTRP